jgi:hypothetical protein
MRVLTKIGATNAHHVDGMGMKVGDDLLDITFYRVLMDEAEIISS